MFVYHMKPPSGKFQYYVHVSSLLPLLLLAIATLAYIIILLILNSHQKIDALANNNRIHNVKRLKHIVWQDILPI